jgi:hypothetical protein
MPPVKVLQKGLGGAIGSPSGELVLPTSQFGLKVAELMS